MRQPETTLERWVMDSRVPQEQVCGAIDPAMPLLPCQKKAGHADLHLHIGANTGTRLQWADPEPAESVRVPYADRDPNKCHAHGDECRGNRPDCWVGVPLTESPAPAEQECGVCIVGEGRPKCICKVFPESPFPVDGVRFWMDKPGIEEYIDVTESVRRDRRARCDAEAKRDALRATLGRACDAIEVMTDELIQMPYDADSKAKRDADIADIRAGLKQWRKL